jgi:hypothetical protein
VVENTGPIAVFGATVAARYFTGKGTTSSSILDRPAMAMSARMAGAL